MPEDIKNPKEQDDLLSEFHSSDGCLGIVNFSGE
jgi:hypothetical protein